MAKTYEEYVELYDEETAKYLIETLGDWLKNYKKCTFINTNARDTDAYIETTKQFTIDKNWEYEEVTGDTGLVYRLLNGDWNTEEFLIVPPNKNIMPSYSENIIEVSK